MFELNKKNIKSLATIGGKGRLLKLLIPILRTSIEQHGTHTFVDVFGGGNKIIPHLDDYVQEAIYNDIDRGFCNVMACCTEMDLLQDMIDIAHHYQFRIQTNETFKEACQLRVDPSTPMVESAALTVIVQAFSRAADRTRFSKADALRGISYASLLRFRALYLSMSNTTVLCTDFKNLLDDHKYRSDSLLYLDPPYFGTDSYAENIDHRELAERIVDATAYIILSNFDNPIYEETLVQYGWNKYSLGVIAKSSSATRGSTQPEFIWSNFDIPEHLLPSIEMDVSTK